MKIQMVLAAAVACFSTSPAAALSVYECALTVGHGNNWVPKQIVVSHDENTNEVTVSDGIINHFTGAPTTQGKVAVSNKKRNTFSWSVRTRTSTGQKANMSYRLTYVHATQKASVTARPIGYDNSFQAAGKCAVTQK